MKSPEDKTFNLHKHLMEGENPFWTEVDGKIYISVSELFEFLSRRGFRKHSLSETMRIPQLYKIDDGIVDQVNIGAIISEIKEFLLIKQKRHILDYAMKSNLLYKSENLHLLDSLEDNFLNDTRKKSFIAFKNLIIEITPNEINYIEYKDLKDLVWRSQIIDHDFELKTEDEIIRKSVFNKFIDDISLHSKDREVKRPKHLRSLIGYLLSTYKDLSMAKAVVLIDEDLTGYPNGGTGKSLLANAISKIRKTVHEDGKNLDFSRSFSFQQLDLDTRVLLIDDLKKGFDFERIFPFITAGIQVEKKYQDRFTIPFEISPKILITSNYAIQGHGTSYERRLLEFEVSTFYNMKNTPDKKYKHLFFDDWDKNQWDLFYSFMIYCCQSYINNGIVLSDPLTLEFQKVRETIGRELADYFNEKIEISTEYDKNRFYNEIRRLLPAFDKYSQRMVTEKLKVYAEMMGYLINERRSGSCSFFKLELPR